MNLRGISNYSGHYCSRELRSWASGGRDLEGQVLLDALDGGGRRHCRRNWRWVGDGRVLGFVVILKTRKSHLLLEKGTSPGIETPRPRAPGSCSCLRRRSWLLRVGKIAFPSRNWVLWKKAPIRERSKENRLTWAEWGIWVCWFLCERFDGAEMFENAEACRWNHMESKKDALQSPLGSATS